MSVENTLIDAIETGFDELDKMEVGSDQYKSTVNGLTMLVDRIIDLNKIEMEHDIQIENRKQELELKREQMEDEKRDRLIKNCLTGASIVTTVGLTIWGACKSWEFEKEGTITSTFGRMFMNCFRLKK